jgi:hypothetical protein
MKRRRPRIVPPPYPGPVVWGGVLESSSEQEKEGRPPAPPIVWADRGPEVTDGILEAIRDEEKADRPPAPGGG